MQSINFNDGRNQMFFKLQVASVNMMSGMKIIFMFSCRDMIDLVDAANVFVNILSSSIYKQ